MQNDLTLSLFSLMSMSLNIEGRETCYHGDGTFTSMHWPYIKL